MNPSLKLLVTAFVLSLLAACGGNTSNTEVASTGKSADSLVTAISAAMAVNAYRPDPVTRESPTKQRDLYLAPTPTNISLGAPEASQVDAARKNNEATATNQLGKPLQIGFGRDVAQTATTLGTNQVLKWQTTTAGVQVAAINFNSTGAKGMRVGLLVNQLPESATLRFYAKGAATAFEVTGAEVWKVLTANLAAGDKSEAGRTYWGPVVDSSDATLEVELPSGVNTSTVNIAIPSVSHFFISAKDASTAAGQTTYSGDYNLGLTCQVDVTCTAPLPAASDAVAFLIFNKGSGSYICSGTLLNDSISSGTPYLLTANHCISTQTVASTLRTRFQYRSMTCNDAANGTYFETATSGSKLLYSAYGTDSTLVQLYGSVNSPTPLYAGWDATTAPATSTTGIHSIHHPRGDQQRLSRGSITGYSTRETNTTLTDYDVTFYGSNITNGTILNVTLTTGLTEGGSSGSGLFRGADSNPQLIGQLFGGNAPSCGVPKYTVYGRFDTAFNAGMKDWLVQGIKMVSQLYNASTGIHYYTNGQTDISNFSASNPAYGNQGEVFKVSSYQTAGLSPVYRFYNTSNGSYFYTISEKEKTAVASNTPRMRYDGVVWYASATSAIGTMPLYSAFNKATGSQYFTTSLTTRSNLIAANPQFIADGIAFYVTP